MESVTEFRATVLRRIEQFIVLHGLSDTTFGQQAVNDGHFVQDLREGVNMTLRRLERAEAFMRAAPDFLAVQAGRKLTASLTIHDINDSVKARLKMRAAERGHSVEEEARRILCAALDRAPPSTLADLATALFGPEHGIELEVHPAIQPSAATEFAEE
jgi:plasmid stability protein